ncbi:hypothetical protein PBY51_019424 [Eleginops maclovinus]|uniref:C-type lectin domain-containing protein n=1 Tax=Eleginops maclovinus TaxID=56733 RepID=A0AAN8AY20_ELEMC|nr:hypothetical protein PBY51_019424 [Eleginops maclovinus]
MEKKIVLLVPFVFFFLSTPPCGSTSGVSNFKVIPIAIKLDWYGAQTYCREHYSDLANINNQAQADMIAPYKGWIGMKWKSGQWTLSRGEKKAVFNRFGSGAEASDGYCAESHSATEWHSHECSEARIFLCEERLNLVQEEKTWEEALQHCRELQDFASPTYTYDLASLANKNKTVLDRVALRPYEVWVGLRFMAGEWLWMNGARATPRRLRECPDQQQHCGAVAHDAVRLKALNCSERRFFLCDIKW